MVVDDSEINKKLFCRLLAMEGFTNVETASHGLECVEKLILFREQTLARWKKCKCGIINLVEQSVRLYGSYQDNLNLVKIHETFEDLRNVYVIMEYNLTIKKYL